MDAKIIVPVVTVYNRDGKPDCRRMPPARA